MLLLALGSPRFGCPTCARTSSKTYNTCGHTIGYSYTDVNGSDGVCYVEGTCTNTPRIWHGSFIVINDTDGSKNIEISVDGNKKTCNNVASGSWCEMSWAGGATFPNVTAACPNGSEA